MRRTVRLVFAPAALAPSQHLRRCCSVEAADSSLSVSRRGIGFGFLQVFGFLRHSSIYTWSRRITCGYRLVLRPGVPRAAAVAQSSESRPGRPLWTTFPAGLP